MNSERGKLIVIYGPNNLGKTLQANLLVGRLQYNDVDVEYVKYPIYKWEPTGPQINRVLRQGEVMTDRSLQHLFAQNRRDYEPVLVRSLNEGAWIVAEDYKGTGIAWGVVNGIPLEEMERLNAGLREEDLAIMLDAEERFHAAIEKGHRHEEGRDWYRARDVHRELAERYGWRVVNAVGLPEEVHTRVWEVVKPLVKVRGG